MTSAPNGRLERTPGGHDLVVTRVFRAGVEDVWASITEPERTARWFGPWEGEAAPGHTVKVQMAFEEGTPWMDFRIDACDPPRRLAVSSVDEHGVWHVELVLAHENGRTELRLIHHLETTDGIGDVGPGWEYYLDMLAASRDGTPRPSFDDYFPAMKPHYEALRTEA